MTTPTPSDSTAHNTPPDLEYTLRTRKKSIFIFWTLILIDAIAVPIVLYYALWYYTSLSPNAVFSISTAALGGVSIFEYFLRTWRLYKKDSTCRIEGAHRYYLDWFHWTFSFSWLIIMIELIVGTVQHDPYMRLLAMPLPSLLFVYAIHFIMFDIAEARNFRTPYRISSTASGELLRPGLYYIIEDIVAVDGSGGTGYRKRLSNRYEASPRFRQMIRKLSWFWSVPGLAIAAGTTAIIFGLKNREISYIIGWTLPFVWAGVWTVITIKYVQRQLRIELEEWDNKGEAINRENKV